MNLNDKVIWITGASSGIGEHLAYACARAGAKLVLSARNQAELERVSDKARRQFNAETMTLPLDVAAFDQHPQTVQTVIVQMGTIDVLINNAGISQREFGKNTKFEVDQKIMNVNFLGAVSLTKAVLPVMLEKGAGQIVAISSVLGKLGVPGRTSYAASKHALHGFYDCLRAELYRDNIEVTVICPGYVHTNVAVNALKGDGTKNNIRRDPQKGGFTPEVFAERAIKAIIRGEAEAWIGKREIAGIYLNRFFPNIFRRIARGMEVLP